MKTFEYKIENYSGEIASLSDCLNKLGKNGWELVEIIPTNNCIFKRKIKKDSDWDCRD